MRDLGDLGLGIDPTEVEDPTVDRRELRRNSTDSGDSEASEAADDPQGSQAKKKRKKKKSARITAANRRKRAIDEEEDLTELEREMGKRIRQVLRQSELGSMIVALVDSTVRRLMTQMVDMKQGQAETKAWERETTKDMMEMRQNLRQLVSAHVADNSVQSICRQLGLPWTSIASVCAVIDSEEQSQMLECHVRDTINNHGGHWHLNLNIELFDKDFVGNVFVFEQRLVPDGEEYSTRPIHFCMEDYWLLPLGLTKLVRGLIEDRKKRQNDTNDLVSKDREEASFRSITSVYCTAHGQRTFRTSGTKLSGRRSTGSSLT